MSFLFGLTLIYQLIQLICAYRDFLENSTRIYNHEPRLFTMRRCEVDISLLETVYTH